MTEQDAITFLTGFRTNLEKQRDGKMGDHLAKGFQKIHGEHLIEVLQIAQNAIEEVQQYRKIGTIEECRRLAAIKNTYGIAWMPVKASDSDSESADKPEKSCVTPKFNMTK